MSGPLPGWASYDVRDLREFADDHHAAFVALYLLARTRWLRVTTSGLEPGLARELEEDLGLSSSMVTRALRRIEESDRWRVWRTADAKLLGVELETVVTRDDRPPGTEADPALNGRHPCRPRSSPVTTDTVLPEIRISNRRRRAVITGDDRGAASEGRKHPEWWAAGRPLKERIAKACGLAGAGSDDPGPVPLPDVGS